MATYSRAALNSLQLKESVKRYILREASNSSIIVGQIAHNVEIVEAKASMWTA